MITTMFFILVPFLKRAPCIIIHLARNAEKGGGVLMSIILPNLNHSFVPDSGSGSGSGSGFRIPDSGSGSVSGFRISWFSIRPSNVEELNLSQLVSIQVYMNNLPLAVLLPKECLIGKRWKA